jgi:hypothetical protein
MLSKIQCRFRIRNPRFGIQKKPIPDPRFRVNKGHGPGVKKAQDPRSGSATLITLVTGGQGKHVGAD